MTTIHERDRLVVGIIVLAFILYCIICMGCASPKSDSPVDNKKEITTGEGDDTISSQDSTEVENKNVQNSTWLLLGQKIIDTIKGLVYFIVIAFVVYKWIKDGSIKFLGSGR